MERVDSDGGDETEFDDLPEDINEDECDKLFMLSGKNFKFISKCHFF